MSNFHLKEPHQPQQKQQRFQQQLKDNPQLTFNQQTMKNLAALAQLTAQNLAEPSFPPATSGSVISSMAVATNPPSSNYSFESFPGLTSSNNALNFPASNNLSSLVGDRDCIPMNIRCKFGNLGPNQGQFHSPHGFCMGLNEDIVVADTYNHRIQVMTTCYRQISNGKVFF